MKQQQKGLYVPSMEKDSCGTGFIANLNGIKSHKIIEDALTMLQNMEHRGACYLRIMKKLDHLLWQ